MKSIREIIHEEVKRLVGPVKKLGPLPIAQHGIDESEAGEEAKKLRLTHRGKGRYYDASGKYVAKSVNGKLVKVSPEEAPAQPAPDAAPTAPAPDATPNTGKPKLHKFPSDPAKATKLSDALRKKYGDKQVPNINGSPILVTVGGKVGAIDIIEEDKVHVTFEDGEFGWIPKDEVQTYRKPKGNPTDAPIFPGDPGDSDLGFTKDPAQPSPLAHQAAPIDYDEQLRQMLKGFKNLSGEEVTDPKTLKMMKKIFDSNGRWVPQSADTGATHINPGWNKTKEDIPFDANGEETVAKLLQMVGDPMKLLRWLIKTYAKETPNGKQRLLQYMGILKKMGVLDQGEAQDVAADSGVPLA